MFPYHNRLKQLLKTENIFVFPKKNPLLIDLFFLEL